MTKPLKEDSAIEKPTRRKAVAEPKVYAKSRKRTSLQEFAFVNNLRPEVLAGFKAWLKGEEFHFDNEWKTLFEQYRNR